MNEFTFKQLNWHLQESLASMQITEPSEVQKAAIPHALAGEDLLIQASTGSGKTLSFLLPVLEQLELQTSQKHFPRVLILCPTRELCQQIAGICRKLLANREGIRTSLLTGGVDMNAQVRATAKGADIVVGTPARVLDHLRRHTFKPKQCTKVILDEADIMLSLGFEEAVRECISQLPVEQTMLFSATYNDSVKNLAESILQDPFRCEIENHDKLEQKIEEKAVIVNEKQKIDVLKKLLRKADGQTIVFCNKRVTTDFITGIIKEAGYTCACVHSDTDPGQRRREMQSFRDHKVQILCATDAVSRGIDIPEASLVVSYDLPDVMDTLVHRFGRTARAGTTGTAYVLLTPAQASKTELLKQIFPEISVNRRAVQKPAPSVKKKAPVQKKTAGKKKSADRKTGRRH